MALTGYCFFLILQPSVFLPCKTFYYSCLVWWCFQRYRQIHFFWLKRIHCPYPTRNFWRGDPRSMDPPTDLAHRPLNRPVHGLPPRITFTDPPYNKKGQLGIWQRTIYRQLGLSRGYGFLCDFFCSKGHHVFSKIFSTLYFLEYTVINL